MPIIDSTYNIVTNVSFFVFSFNLVEVRASFIEIGSGIYTLVLGILYIALTAFFFYKRKSESAERSAPNTVLQTIYRISCAMVICLIPCSMIYSQYIEESESSSIIDLFLIVLFYLFALLVYFIYELITTRKWKNLLSAIPSLGFLVLLNLVFIFSVITVHNKALDFEPSADEIRSIRLVSNDHFSFFDDHGSYINIKRRDIHLTDSAILEMVSKQLAETNKQVKKLSGSGYGYSVDERMLSIAFEMSGRTIYRNIVLTDQNETLLKERLAQNPEYNEIYSNLPVLGESGTSVTIYQLSKADAEEIYEQFKKEWMNMSFEKKYDHITQNFSESSFSGKDSIPLAEIEVQTHIGVESPYFYLYITKGTPDTYKLYIDKINKTETADIMQQALKDALQSPTQGAYFQVNALEENNEMDNKYYDLEFLSASEEREIERMISELEKNRSNAVDIEKPILQLDLYGLELVEHEEVMREKTLIYYMNG
jgi:ABC-2 type transport system permease protein